MSIEVERRETQRQLDLLLSKNSLTVGDRKTVDGLLGKLKTLRNDQDRVERVAALAKEIGQPVAAQNGGSEFRKKFLSECRTYQPLNETDNGLIIPSAFEVKLASLMLADGPLYAQSPLLTNLYAKQMQSTKVAVSNDLQPGYVVNEDTAPSEAELTTGLSGVSVGGNGQRFSTGILLASVALATDAWPSLEEIISKAASARLSRIQNTTNLTMLKTALALNSSAGVAAGSASITADSVYTLIGSVGAAYRSSASFILSPTQQSALGSLKSSTGKRIFPHVLDAQATLAGYPAHLLNGAASSDCLFGDYSFIFCKSTPVEMKVLKERYLLEGFYGYVMSVRAEAKWTVASTSDSPVKYLTFA